MIKLRNVRSSSYSPLAICGIMMGCTVSAGRAGDRSRPIAHGNQLLSSPRNRLQFSKVLNILRGQPSGGCHHPPPPPSPPNPARAAVTAHMLTPDPNLKASSFLTNAYHRAISGRISKDEDKQQALAFAERPLTGKDRNKNE